MSNGPFGLGGYGSSPYGSLPPPFGVSSAMALDGTHVQVAFSALLDFSYPALLVPSNYSISPSLVVVAVEELTTDSVVLTTSQQSNILYEVTVATARSTLQALIDPLLTTATFTGFPFQPGFFGVATGVTRVRAVFAQTMLNNSNLSNISNYTITDLNDNVVTILTATPEQSSNPVSVLLALGSDLHETGFYVLTVSSNIHTATGLSILPPTSVFQWVQGATHFDIPESLFHGEAFGGLFGDHDGLVFFSPALNVSTPNSIIQIEEVDVCTTAFDTYRFPEDRVNSQPVLYTDGAGLVATPYPVTGFWGPDPYLLNQCVLWSPFPRNFEATFDLDFMVEDFYSPPEDASCSILINQQFAPGYVALLNDPAWYLFNDTAGTSVPPTFITAKNLMPIPPGPETIIMLHQQLTGESSFGPAPATLTAKAFSTLAGRSTLFAGAGPPPVILANASITAGSSFSAQAGQRFGGFANFRGHAFVTPFASEGGHPPTQLIGDSFIVANGTTRQQIKAALHAHSEMSSLAFARRGALAPLFSQATVQSEPIVHYHAADVMGASSSVSATAGVTHHAQAILVAGANVMATAT